MKSILSKLFYIAVFFTVFAACFASASVITWLFISAVHVDLNPLHWSPFWRFAGLFCSFWIGKNFWKTLLALSKDYPNAT